MCIRDRLNPDCDEGLLRKGMEFDGVRKTTGFFRGKIKKQLARWTLSDLGLSCLPESFCTLRVKRGLFLNGNQLSSLPDSFGSIHVGGDLHLNDNQLSTLPDSFSELEVGGAIHLHNNPLD
eukprot:TRINITY_DN53512_c0_g1_i1.p1 TRINITY_DN53512_c0_g1~~TRINITY_DN53512_c0_g1_i1.p1  ORF type:complete len:121 (+),score=23.72 TRINITY_DN53512_c0_g1_i1:70-432(+)